MEFSHIDQYSDKIKKIDLSEIIEQQSSNLKLEFPHREIRFFNDEKPIIIDGYEELISSAVENILRNACKYTPEETPIDINIKDQNNSIEILIRDYGSGILNHEKEKLLQPFFRSGNKMHTDGFGLGLSITQKAIKQHNGKLELNNHPDGGLLVKIVLKKYEEQLSN